MPSREEIVHEISSIANWCEDQAASSALEDLATQVENCDSNGELLNEMVEVLEWISEDGHAMASMTIGSRKRLVNILQKYHEQVGE